VVPNPSALVLEVELFVPVVLAAAALAVAGLAITLLAAGFSEFKIVGIV
jgi:hypothetical protein